ncbi:MAG: hypothetical protein IPO21_05635 [Bacteroidales bacterium]|nr:hypothetical protein [Bacteroidales bacterium]
MAQDSKIATLLIDSKSDVGEGAIWDYVEQRLFWIDIPKQMLYIHYPDDTTKTLP